MAHPYRSSRYLLIFPCMRFQVLPLSPIFFCSRGNILNEPSRATQSLLWWPVRWPTALGQSGVLVLTVTVSCFLADNLFNVDTLILVMYPFLTENPFTIRLVIYAGSAAVGYISFRILNAIHS